MLRKLIALWLVVAFAMLPSVSSLGMLRSRIPGPGPQCLNLAADGDSITLGFEATNPYETLISNALGTTSFNHGVGSAGWNVQSGGVFGGSGNLTALAPANIDPKISSLTCANGMQPFLVLFAGLNDIRAGASAATAFATFQTYYNARIAAGWQPNRIIVLTLLNAGISNADQVAYNNSLVSSGNYNLARLDLDANIGCNGCQNNTTYFNSDTIHPNDTGQAIIANIVCNVMQPRGIACPAY